MKEGNIERALDALLSEAERVERFGFTATELDRQKQSVLRNYERLALEKENTLSASRADEYVRNFLQNETLPSADDEYALHKRFLPEVTLAEINKLAAEWFPDRNRIVVIQAPAKAGVVIPDEAKLAAVIKAAAAKDLKAIRGHDRQRGAAGVNSDTGHDREDRDERCHRHYRVGTVQRRQGNSQADDIQRG